MNIICVGINHRSAKVEQREKFTVADIDLMEASNRLGEMDGISESVILSTCNRVELYAATTDPVRGFASLDCFLGERAAAHHYDEDLFYHYDTPLSIRHLFRVASGLESMVLGETEILGQVKKAYCAAASNGKTAKHLNKLFQRAFHVAKEVRTNTQITKGAVSVGSATVDLAEKIFGRHLSSSKVMILGAGETSEMTLRTLFSRGVRTISVCNRSEGRAVSLAAEIGGRAIPFGDWEKTLHDVDILIGSTSSPYPLLTKENLAPIMNRRANRPLFVIDLAVPRDVDPQVNELDGVFLHDIDSIRTIADESMRIRRKEISVCEDMINRHVGEYLTWLNALPLRQTTGVMPLMFLGEAQCQ